MCKVADAAKTMINRAIDLAKKEKESGYYVDFYKLHKLLYFAQWDMLAHYGKPLFEEEIEAHNCGPFIPAILDLGIGYAPIKEPFPENDVFPITSERVEAIDLILALYGTKSADELVNLSKQSRAYRDNYKGKDEHQTIPKEDMRTESPPFDFHKEIA